ncbi:disks large-associated protein 5-like isoform X2 [Hyperolius riggenbachi]|uniref:disks large-associated protein 5-like isoform X2 n=1 Tax=Hyperolius riggenbachi TaxID=752182 RepID=UPI0035A35C70
MDIQSRFADRYKKDASVDLIRAKVARRKSISQKENRHKEFRRSRGLGLVDINISGVREHDLTVPEEEDEGKSINQAVVLAYKETVKAKERRALLQKYKEEKEVRRLKELREKEKTKPVFKCGRYKAENLFIPQPTTSQQAQKIKPMKKVHRITVCDHTILKKEEKENKVSDQSQKRMNKKMQEKAVTKSKAALIGQDNTEQLESVVSDEEKIVETCVKEGRKPPFAPQNYGFQPLDGLPAVMFEPITPNRANELLTPTFTWSPTNCKNFVFTRDRGSKVNPVSPPAVPTTTTTTKLKMDANSTFEANGDPIGAETVATVTPPTCAHQTSPPASNNMEQSQESLHDVPYIRCRLSINVNPTSPPDELTLTPAAEPDMDPKPVCNAQGDAREAEMVTIVTPAACDQPASPPANNADQSKEIPHDVLYLRGLLKSKIQWLTSMCTEWEKRMDMDITEDEKDLITQNVGQTRLLITEKLKQYEAVLDNHQFKVGENDTGYSDLEGVWNLISLKMSKLTIHSPFLQNEV